MPKHYYRVLTIAGSDSGGGAGIQADLKTFSAHRCFGMSALTALTAQNTLGVQSIHTLPAAFVSAQIESVISDIGVDAIKIGMLEREEIILAVSKSLSNIHCPIIVDPVMFAKGGAALLSPGAISVLRNTLFSIATIVTPNIPEAEYLSDMKINTLENTKSAAIKISGYGVKNVLIKGGHSDSKKCIDVLYQTDKKIFSYYTSRRIDTKNTHGTGCTLSAAIAAHCASGKDIPEAVRLAKRFLYKAIRSGKNYTCGHGHGPVNHNAK